MWKGLEPIVYHVTQVYEKGITVDSETLATFKVDWHPDDDLPQWAVIVNPA